MRVVRAGLMVAGLAATVLTVPASTSALAVAPEAKPTPVACGGAVQDRVMRGVKSGADPNDRSLAEVRAAEKRMTAKLRSKGLDWQSTIAKGLVTVNIRYHVITKADGTGGVTRKQLDDQTAVMNAAYGGRSAKGDFPTVFRFKTKSVDYTKNDDWYDWSDPDSDPADDNEAKAALHKGGWGDLNVYIAGLGDGLLGYAYFPDEATLTQDGVVILNDSLPGGSAEPYNEGDTLTHEAGHWLGLYHTFENGCTSPGDMVADTPYQADGDNIFFCEESDDTCSQPGKDPVHNFMSYGDDPCLDRFTLGQGIRMALVWLAYRA
ncbi:zinc metalloprotease [Spongisporangium articulatum]|uniref:Zinc metalloprotease n=1 Tax=Spongisporangium articulatum TaxID=3362603 RepID=A0ABW8AQN0_9ACTN